MSLLFRCRVCGGRHWGKCPVTDIYLALIRLAEKVCDTTATEPERPVPPPDLVIRWPDGQRPSE